MRCYFTNISRDLLVFNFSQVTRYWPTSKPHSFKLFDIMHTDSFANLVNLGFLILKNLDFGKYWNVMFELKKLYMKEIYFSLFPVLHAK